MSGNREAEFDYVIVGGGSAGCVLAERLSRDPHYSVCLIEAGQKDSDLRIKVPFGLVNLMGNQAFDWTFKSTAQPAKKGKSVSVPRGKTLGGSGSINSMVYIRGRKTDYDRWAALGAEGWGWSDVLPYFKDMENNSRLRQDPLHGTDGPLHVQDLPSPHPLTDVWQQAGKDLQIPRSHDFNGTTQEGLGVYQTTMKKGRRWSAADAFLRPALKRPNLTVITGWQVDHIMLDGTRARAVRLVKQDGKQVSSPYNSQDNKQARSCEIGVRGEVILSAGAIGSPAILMKSGIGRPDDLSKIGVQPVIPLVGVGQNLQDHPAVAVFHGGRRSGYGLSLSQLPSLALSPLRYLATRSGLLASNTVEAGGFAKTDSNLEAPDVQFHFIPARLGHQGKMIVWGRGYYCDVCLLKPKSRGQITLADAFGKLNIDPNLLADPDDQEKLIKGLKLLRRIMAAPAFDHMRNPELAPGPEVQSDEALADYIAHMMGTAYHPVGTCKMGRASDALTVVTPDLKLQNTENIRVVDASVMPEIVAGNTNAPTMMIAAKAGDIIASATKGK